VDSLPPNIVLQYPYFQVYYLKVFSLSEAMTSNICRNLLRRVWIKDYDMTRAPEEGGIYCIGEWNGSDYDVIYVGRTNNIRRRLGEHRRRNAQEIDQYIHEFEGDLRSLAIKWIPDPDNQINEGEYLDCIEQQLGYWPKYNMQGGNTDS
jgi:hypothetical protein